MNQRRHSMRFALMATLALALTAPMRNTSAQTGKRAWSFDQDRVGKMPPGFTSALTGQGTIGQWSVMKDDSAPSQPNVLAQTSTDSTDYRFPLAIADGTSYKDLALSVKFKTISGKVDQGAGLVFRLKDKDNYYITRANALEDNFRLYHVIKGRRVQFAGANLKVTPNAWHEIKVEAHGNEFKCFYDSQLKFTAKDGTFKDAGKIGLWTKADSVIHFDDLAVEDLGNTRSSTSQGKIVAQKLVDELVAKRRLQYCGEDWAEVRPRGPEGDANRESCCAERRRQLRRYLTAARRIGEGHRRYWPDVQASRHRARIECG